MNTHPSKQRAHIAHSNTSSGAGGKRPAIAGPQQSTLQQLEQVVTCEPIWALIENLEAFHKSADPALRRGPGRRYTLMDIVVMEAATQLDGSSREAARTLGDPPRWGRLRRAAARAFPNDPKRRLSPNAPSRHQHYQARRRYLCGEALTVLKRGLRAEAVSAAVRSGHVRPCSRQLHSSPQVAVHRRRHDVDSRRKQPWPLRSVTPRQQGSPSAKPSPRNRLRDKRRTARDPWTCSGDACGSQPRWRQTHRARRRAHSQLPHR